jgi:AraC family transcriptional regulator
MKLPNPEILEAPAKEMLALARDFTMETRHQIPKLWEDYFELQLSPANTEGDAIYGASFGMQPDGSFKYAVGMVVDPPADLPGPTCHVSLRGGVYAVFRMTGPFSDIPAVFDAIFSEWLPASDWVTDAGAVIERYPTDMMGQEEQPSYEVWVPVARKPD